MLYLKQTFSVQAGRENDKHYFNLAQICVGIMNNCSQNYSFDFGALVKDLIFK